MSTLTINRAQELAEQKGRTVWSKGYNNHTGRRVFLVKIERPEFGDDAYHCVTHTSHGFECDKLCPSFVNRHMCGHIGAVVTYIASLDREERTKLLMPVDPKTLKRPQPAKAAVATQPVPMTLDEACAVAATTIAVQIAEKYTPGRAMIGKMTRWTSAPEKAAPTPIAASVPAWVMR